MSTETKPTNPKDAIGSGKLPLDLVPDTAIVELATGFLEGALKYGKYNWRVEGVRASIYIAAAGRHMAKYKNGEDRDKVTRVKHLASVMACCAIIMDAELCGKLVDDRPPAAPMAELIDGYAEHVAHLKELFKDHHPHQHTIGDARITEEPSVANFVHANGVQALFAQELLRPNFDPNRCEVCNELFSERDGRSHDRHRICAMCRPHLVLKEAHVCKEGCPNTPRAAGETS